MAYQVRLKKQAIKTLEKINEPNYSAIKSAILALAAEPRPAGYKKLRGRDAFRIRAGDYRIIYDIHDKILTVEVIDVGHRKEIYK